MSSFSPTSILYNSSGTAIATATANPAGTELALLVRNIPSGTQTVNGTVTIQDGGNTITVDGSVTVAQATAANLQAQVVGSDGSILATANTGRLQVDVISGGGSNPSVGTNGAAEPGSSTEIGFISGGNLVGVSALNPLPISGNITASPASDGATGAAVPASASYMGVNVGGNLVGVTGTGTSLNANITGGTVTTITNAVTVAQATAANLKAQVVGSDGSVLATANTGRLQVDIVTGGGSNASVSATGAAVPASATYGGMNVSGNLTGFTGTGTSLNVNLTNSTIAVTDNAGSLTVDGTVDVGTVTTITNAVTVTQNTASSLNATVVQPTGTNLHTVVDSGTITTVTNAVTVTQNTAANLNATVSQPTGSDLHTVVDSGTITSITNDVNIADGGNSITVDGTVDVGTVTTLTSITNAVTVAQATAANLKGQVVGSDGSVLATANTGRLQVDIITGGGSNASVSATGAAVPASGTYAAMNQGGNLVGLTGTSGNLNVNVANTSIAVTDNGGSLTVDGTVDVGTVTTVTTLGTITNAVTVAQATAANLKANVVGSDGSVLATANTGRLQVDIVTGGGSNASVSATGAAVPASATYGGMSVSGNLTGFTGTGTSLNVNVTNAAVTIQDGGNTITVDGTVDVGTVTTLTSITNAVTVAQATAANLNATVVQATGSNLHTVVDSGTITTITNAVTVAQATASNLKTEVWGGAKGTTTAAVATVSAAGTNNNALDVIIRDSTGAEMDLFRPADLYTAAADHGLLILGQDGGAPARYRPLSTNTSGHVNIADGGNTITVDGGVTLADNLANPTTAVITGSHLMGWDEANSLWRRVTIDPTNGDGVAVHTTASAIDVDAHVRVFNGTSFDRWYGGTLAADAQTATAQGAGNVRGFLYGFNGTTWDRIKAGGSNGDGEATTTLGYLEATAYNKYFNGSTWDRVKGTAAGGAWVQGPAASGAATAGNPVLIGGPVAGGAGNMANVTVKAASTAAAATDTSLVVQLSPSQPNLTTPLNVQGGKTNNNAAPGATNVGVLPGVATAAAPSSTEGNQVALSLELTGNLRTTARASAANSLVSFSVSGPWAASNNATNVKGSAGNIYGYYAANVSTAWRYLKLYNKATAPAPASDNALLVMVVALPPGSAANVSFDPPIYCSSGIGYAVVTGISNTSDTAVTANDGIHTLLYA